MIKALLDKGADVNIKNNQGMTALILATCSGNVDINGHEDIVKVLLDKGADVNAKDIYGTTALKCALDPSAVWLLDRSGKKELLDRVCANLTNNAKDVVKTLCIRGAIYEKKSVQEMEKSEDEQKRIAEIVGKNKVSNFGDSDLKKMTKLILNTNGLLCADIVNIRSLKVRDNIYEVECIEYRSGQNRKTYIMDAAKGTAWNP